ncbi:MAG: hypothetical protein N4A35_10380 [Flavobacteriales bacterium]|jgi:hypothetical protein|nr:hypothetical protein [Flavobacteriales bacterium]
MWYQQYKNNGFLLIAIMLLSYNLFGQAIMGGSVIGKEIKSVTIKTNQKKKESGELFVILIETVLEDGTQIASTTLEKNGQTFNSGYNIVIEGAKEVEHGAHKFESIENLIDGQTIIKVKRPEDSDWLAIHKIDVVGTITNSFSKSSQNDYTIHNYWSNGPVEKAEADPKKVYTFRKLDTIQYHAGAFKNMAILKSDDYFLRATNYTTDDIDKETGTVKNYGFKVHVHAADSKVLQSSTKETAFEAKYAAKPTYANALTGYATQHSGASINSLRKTPTGYVLCGIDMIIIYDHEMNEIGHIQNENKTRDKFFLDVKEVSNSRLYLYTFISLVDPNYSASGAGIYIQLYHPETNGFSEPRLIEKLVDPYDGTGYVNKLVSHPDRVHLFIVDEEKGDFILAYNSVESNKHIGSNIVKGNVEMCTDHNKTIIWKKEYGDLIYNAHQTKDNKLKVIMGTPRFLFGSDGRATLFELDPTPNSYEEVFSTIKTLNENRHFGSIHDAKVYPQENGEYLIFGKTLEDAEIRLTNAIYHYDNNFQLQGVYHFGLPMVHEIYDYGYEINERGSVFRHQYEGQETGDNGLDFNYTHNRSAGRYWNNTYDSWVVRHGVSTSDAPGVHFKTIDEEELWNTSYYFFDNHTAFDFILDGEQLYIMTPFAIMKANIKNITKAIPHENLK